MILNSLSFKLLVQLPFYFFLSILSRLVFLVATEYTTIYALLRVHQPVRSYNPSALTFFSEFRMFSSNLIHRLLPLTRKNTRFLHASQSSLERIKRKSFTPTTSTTLSTSTTQTLPTTANQLLSHPILIIGRQIEIGSILLGYERQYV
jgi:hypothetical protein